MAEKVVEVQTTNESEQLWLEALSKTIYKDLSEFICVVMNNLSKGVLELDFDDEYSLGIKDAIGEIIE